MSHQNDGPVFRDVGQALHVSYLMQVLPPTQRVSTQVLIDALLEHSGKAAARAASTINVGGMSPLEFRGQCAMVVAAARDHLPPPEHAAVRARFGHQLTRAEGVRALCDYVQPMLRFSHEWALIGVCWAIYHKGSARAADRWSMAAIERETGVSFVRLRGAREKLVATGDALQKRAEERLAELFLRTGLIDGRESVCA
jgi:hypothetical protein